MHFILLSAPSLARLRASVDSPGVPASFDSDIFRSGFFGVALGGGQREPCSVTIQLHRQSVGTDQSYARLSLSPRTLQSVQRQVTTPALESNRDRRMIDKHLVSKGT